MRAGSEQQCKVATITSCDQRTPKKSKEIFRIYGSFNHAVHRFERAPCLWLQCVDGLISKLVVSALGPSPSTVRRDLLEQDMLRGSRGPKLKIGLPH